MRGLLLSWRFAADRDAGAAGFIVRIGLLDVGLGGTGDRLFGGVELMARPCLKPIGRIINLTTRLDTMQRSRNSPYGVSKAALEAAQ